MHRLPSAPKITSVPKGGIGALEFCWSPPQDEGSSNIVEYVLTCPDYQIEYYYSSNERSARIFGLENGIQYNFQLAARNSDGLGKYAYFDVQQPGNKPPDAPTDLSIVWKNDTIAGLSWHPPAYKGDSPIKYYVITALPYDPTLVGEVLKYGQEGDNPTRGVDMLVPNVLYSMYVEAINEAGYGPASIPTNYICPKISLWLDASDSKNFLLNNTNVLTWYDRSGLKRDANVLGGASYVTYDENTKSVRFAYDPVSPTMKGILVSTTPAGTFNEGFSIFVVFKHIITPQNLSPPSTTLITRTLGSNIAAPWNMYNKQREIGDAVQNNIYTVVSNYDLSKGGSTTTLFCMTCTNPAFGNSVYNEYINGFNLVQNVQLGGKYADIIDKIGIGGTTANSSEFYNGSMNEIMIFPTVVTMAERLQVEEYLQQKWNINTFAFWFDASDDSTIVTSTQPYWYDPVVTQVLDKSGFTFTGVPQSSVSPITYSTDGEADGKKGLQFYDGNLNFIKFPISSGMFSKGMTVFVVFKSFGQSIGLGGTHGALFNRYNDTNSITINNAAPLKVIQNQRIVGNGTQESTSISANNILNDVYRTLYCGVLTSKSIYSEFINGHFLEYTKKMDFYNDTGNSLGLGIAGPVGFTGFMYEMRMYGYPMMTEERTAVETELKAKWNIIDNPNPGPLAVFTYTGTAQTFTVPANRTSVTVHLWGAGGAGSYLALETKSDGGNGGYISGVLSVTPGATYTILVGGGGTSIPAVTTFGGGGDGIIGGSGGGRSAIRNSIGEELVTAGGGGGAGLAGSTYNNVKGGHGGLVPTSGSNSLGSIGGGAATFISGVYAGGAGSTSPAGSGGTGSQYTGGNVSDAPAGNRSYSGGGGGGYYGGGSGVMSSNAGDGGSAGGGGISFSGSLQSVVNWNGSDTTGPNSGPAYQTIPGYINGAGLGGKAGYSPDTIHLHGGDGLVIIY